MDDRLNADLRRLEEAWRTKQELLRSSTRPRKFGLFFRKVGTEYRSRVRRNITGVSGQASFSTEKES